MERRYDRHHHYQDQHYKPVSHVTQIEQYATTKESQNRQASFEHAIPDKARPKSLGQEENKNYQYPNPAQDKT